MNRMSVCRTAGRRDFFDPEYAQLRQRNKAVIRRSQIRRRHRAAVLRRRFRAGITMVFLLLCLLLILSGTHRPTSAQSLRESSRVHYTSVVVSAGDTIWSIAEETQADSGFRTLKEYTRAIRQLNGRSSSRIYPGETLILPVR